MSERKNFNPMLFRDWNESLDAMDEHDQVEFFKAIRLFPNYEPKTKEKCFWVFLRGQLQKQLDTYTQKCEKNQRIANERERQRTNDHERARTCTNVDERHLKSKSISIKKEIYKEKKDGSVCETENENLTPPASLDATQDACVSKKPSSRKPSVCKPDDVEQADWDEYLSIRKAKKLPLTQRGLNLLRSEADKAGMTLQQVIVKCLEAGWAGFKAEWVKKETEEDKQSIFYVPPEQRSKKPWNGENPFAPVPDDSDYLKMNLGAFGRSSK